MVIEFRLLVSRSGISSKGFHDCRKQELKTEREGQEYTSAPNKEISEFPWPGDRAMHPCVGAMHPFRRRQTKLPGMTRDVIDVAAGLVMVKILAKTSTQWPS